MRVKYANQSFQFLNDIHAVELKAFKGLLLYTAVFKSNHESADSLFATDGTGRDVFRCTMSKKTFLLILTALRFDDATDWEERKREDRAAAISKLFDRFITNRQSCYSVGENVCIDEMLVGLGIHGLN